MKATLFFYNIIYISDIVDKKLIIKKVLPPIWIIGLKNKEESAVAYKIAKLTMCKA
jgi:hypothetical protein